jgi:hypothetical protein
MTCSIQQRFIQRFFGQSKGEAGSMADLAALQLLQPLMPQYFPYSSSALRPNALLRLVNDVYSNNRRTAIEFGAGASTLILGRALHNVQGSLVSVEHDPDWARVVKEAIDRAGLGDTVEIVVADLIPQRFNGHEYIWYRRTVVENSIGGKRCDLVVVDGPPAYEPGTEYRRFPAIPVLMPYLADRYTIALDDATRAGEKQIVTEWATMLGLTFSTSETANMAFARSGQAFHC